MRKKVRRVTIRGVSVDLQAPELGEAFRELAGGVLLPASAELEQVYRRLEDPIDETDPLYIEMEQVFVDARSKARSDRANGRRNEEEFQREVVFAYEVLLGIEYRWGRNRFIHLVKSFRDRHKVFKRLHTENYEFLDRAASQAGHPQVTTLATYVAQMLFARDDVSYVVSEKRQSWEVARCLQLFMDLGAINPEECSRVIAEIGSPEKIADQFESLQTRALEQPLHGSSVGDVRCRFIPAD